MSAPLRFPPALIAAIHMGDKRHIASEMATSGTGAGMVAFQIFNCSYSIGMELLKTGRFPLEPSPLGRTFRFRKSDVHRLLGIVNMMGDHSDHTADHA